MNGFVFLVICCAAIVKGILYWAQNRWERSFPAVVFPIYRPGYNGKIYRVVASSKQDAIEHLVQTSTFQALNEGP